MINQCHRSFPSGIWLSENQGDDQFCEVVFFAHFLFEKSNWIFSANPASLLWASSGLVKPFFFSDRIKSINFINFPALKGPEGGPDIIDVLKSSGVGEQFQEWPWKFLLIPWLMETIKHQFGWLRHYNFPRRDHFSRYFIHKLRHINAQSNGKKDLGHQQDGLHLPWNLQQLRRSSFPRRLMTLRSMIAIPGTTKIPNAEANLVPRQNGFGSAGEYLVAPKRKRTAFFSFKGCGSCKNGKLWNLYCKNWWYYSFELIHLEWLEMYSRPVTLTRSSHHETFKLGDAYRFSLWFSLVNKYDEWERINVDFDWLPDIHPNFEP